MMTERLKQNEELQKPVEWTTDLEQAETSEPSSETVADDQDDAEKNLGRTLEEQKEREVEEKGPADDKKRKEEDASECASTEILPKEDEDVNCER